MKMKKIMLVAFILLAILTIGSVSASDDADFNETLTADNVGEVSADASLEDNVISEDSDDLIASSEDDNLGDSVTQGNLHPWVSTHEPVNADWNPWIVNVHGDDKSGQLVESSETVFSDAQKISNGVVFGSAVSDTDNIKRIDVQLVNSDNIIMAQCDSQL